MKVAENLTVTVVQNDLKWEDKHVNLISIENKIKGNKSKMEIVFLPEMFSTGFSMKPSLHAETMDGETVAWMKRVASEYRIILAGSLMVKENGNYYNRLVWMLPNGNFGIYDKRHLFAYAGEDEHYTSGNKRLIASVKGWKINLQVCYDLRFPVWARQSAPENEKEITPEYDVLVYVANWPDKRVHAWKTLLQARAIENQCYVVGINRVGNDVNNNHYPGVSMIIDPLGLPLYTGGDQEEIFNYTLSLKELQEVREKLPFLKDADSFKIGI